MPQEILLNEIKELGNEISRNRVLNSNNPIYTVDKNEVKEWFQKIENFTENENIEYFKERLEFFINENKSCLDTEFSVIDESIFQRMRQEFRECFINTNYFEEN